MMRIADSMSRLRRYDVVGLREDYSPIDILCANIITKFELSSDECKIISSVHNSLVVAILAFNEL